MIPATSNSKAKVKIALSQDKSSVIFGSNSFVIGYLRKNLFWNDPIDVPFENEIFKLSLSKEVASRMIILEIKGYTLNMALQFLKNNNVDSMVFLIFTEISRDLIQPFLSRNNPIYFTTNIEDDFINECIVDRGHKNRVYSTEVLNFLSYLEV